MSFPSLGPAWRKGAPVVSRAELAQLSRMDLENVYNAEMRRLRATGKPDARELASTWNKKPKSAILELVSAIYDAGAPLEHPWVLDESARPILQIGTRLYSREHRRWAVVVAVTASGRSYEIKVHKEENEEVRQGPGYITSRDRRLNDEFSEIIEVVEFSPPPSPDRYGDQKWWTLCNKEYRWELEPVADAPPTIVKYSRTFLFD
jgi:hypothetical protein